MSEFTPAKQIGRAGFTLIELSIVLVIVGLIVGGVLVGRDLIKAAEVRAQISQIEKYNAAVNTFRGKYGYLPGDIPDPYASQFGFQARGHYPGQGDGNGVIEGMEPSGSNVYTSGIFEGGGETLVFWDDLGAAALIEGSFTSASSTTASASGTTGTAINSYLPQAKIGGGNYIYVYSGLDNYQWWQGKSTGINYFGLSAVTNLQNEGLYSNATLTVQQAYAIDSKVDDGSPQTGRVIAMYVNESAGSAFIAWAPQVTVGSPPYTTATPGSATTCFDNGNTAGAVQQYSMSQNGGAGLNCALSFKFQ